MARGATETIPAAGVAARPPRRLIGVPAAGSDEFRLWIDWIGHELGTRRAPTLDAHLGAFADTAMALGIAPISARVVGDPGAPGVTRARAFFEVAAALDDGAGRATI